MISKGNVKFADSEVRMASRFASSTQQEIEKLLEDKDSENTKRSTKVAKELFYEYLKEKNIQEPHDKKELAQVLKSFYVEARKKDGSFYSMGSLKTLRFGLNSRQFSSMILSLEMHLTFLHLIVL